MDHLWDTLEPNSAQQLAESYFGNARDDLLECAGMTSSPHTVLELGCGCGATLRSARAKWPSARLIGVEPNLFMATRAREFGDIILEGKIEDFLPHGLPSEEIDLVIAGDVLEHLYNPWKVLLNLSSRLRPNGKIVASIPNVRNLSLIQQLVLGNWAYETAGLLDITHIRFFTKITAERMFLDCGYRIEETSFRIDPRHMNLLSQIPESGAVAVNLDGMTLTLDRQDVIEMCALQFIIVAHRQ